MIVHSYSKMVNGEQKTLHAVHFSHPYFPTAGMAGAPACQPWYVLTDAQYQELLRDDPNPTHMAGRYLATFYMIQLPGNCGTVVSHHTALNRQQGYGYEKWMSDAFRELKEDLAKRCKYTIMICTVVETNSYSVSNMKKSKYEVVKRFVNKRTRNTILVGIKDIP